jgi:hypothetical protein
LDIFDLKSQHQVKAIKFCLNFNDKIKLLSVDYSCDKDIYKCDVLDNQFGGLVTIRLDGDFVRNAIKRVYSGKPLLWFDPKGNKNVQNR